MTMMPSQIGMGHGISPDAAAALLMQAALAKQSRGYGGGGGGFSQVNLSDGMPVSRRDVKENFHLRGLQRRAEMQGLSDALHQSRMANVMGSMPAGSQQFAGDAAAFPGLQTNLMQGLGEKSAEASFLSQLRGGEAVDPQMIRNRSLTQLYKGGNLADDEAGSRGFTPQQMVDFELQAAGELGGDTNVNVANGLPATVVGQAKEADDAISAKSEWNIGPLSKDLGIGFNPSAQDLAEALGQREAQRRDGIKTDLPELTPENLHLLRLFLGEQMKEDKNYYTPGQQPGIFEKFMKPHSGLGYRMLDRLLADPAAEPDPKQLNEFAPQLNLTPGFRSRQTP